jgi:hypothetical protein
VFRANRAVALAKKTGTPLPHVDFLSDWYKDEGGREIYQGELVMVAGRPGALKSFFSLAFAQATGLHALYMSADSDAATQTARLAANITGHQVRDIRQQMVENPDAEAYYANALASSKVMFAFDSNPEWYDIEDEVSAYVELYDRFPDIIIADNLRNVYTSSESEYAGYAVIMQKLLDLTRDTGATVIVLHHMLESGKDNVSTKPAPVSGLDGKVSKLPELILSLAIEENMSKIATVKDRHTKAHPEADAWVTVQADPAKARFYPYAQLQDRANQFAGTNVAPGVAWTPTSVLGS